MSNYEYHKKNYKAYTVKLHRERDADIIQLLNSGAEITGIIRCALRYYLTLKKGAEDHVKG